MQGYILSTVKVRDEDLIVSILTQNRLMQLYRFYGARHSLVQLGYKIDFEQEGSGKSSISRLRHVVGLLPKWMRDHSRLLIWQQLCRHLLAHLQGVEELDGFYFELLEKLNRKMVHQNPKRSAIEAYVSLLKHEGRLHGVERCFFCEQPLHDEPKISLARAFLPAHFSCVYGPTHDREKFIMFIEEEDTLHLEDHEVDALHKVMSEGF